MVSGGAGGGRSPPPRRPSQPPPQGKIIDPDIIVEAHNKARRETGAPPLRWSDRLASIAQAWADRCVWQHSSYRLGENLAAGNYKKASDVLYGIGMWYNEICEYDFDKSGWQGGAGHYTQMVWADTTEVGCGYTLCADLVGLWNNVGMLVCNYNPPGNILSQWYFEVNVGRPSSFPAMCPKGWKG
ncbi:hypothetical protein HYH03_001238 [Edaphochlamys debaryana]|uniref:SCP domain-containing protein n=1 Tax=Edaphochlamys debaryana TaxID=47281 RepID=A0A835YHT1_9CHLO|nr:hypothetical protein HYH03_001238 [Edaphochlamys debaryana]|eukprot:KAG2501458.1 hypothetical protein HYH03_001238 [Edaphochlamys debaryana]